MACPFHNTCHASLHQYTPVETRKLWPWLQEFNFISTGKKKLLGAGIGGFGVENLETMKGQFEGMWPRCGVQRVLCCVWAGVLWQVGQWCAWWSKARGRTEARSPVWEACAISQSNASSMVVMEMERKTGIRALSKEELQGNGRLDVTAEKKGLRVASY